MSFKSLLAAFCLAFSALFVTVGSATAAESLAVINIQDIMRDSLAAKSVKKKLEAKQKSFQSEMAEKEKSLQSEEQSLAQQRGSLKPEEFDSKVKAFREKAARAQRDVQSKKAKLDKAFSGALEKIQQTVTKIAQDIAQQRGAKVVMPTSQLLYADKSLDITQEVLNELNKQLPSVNVNF